MTARPADQHGSRKRFRWLTGSGKGSSGFMNNLCTPTTAGSDFLKAKATNLARPLAFGSPIQKPAGLKASGEEAAGCLRSDYVGVAQALGPNRLVDAFKAPFHGIALDDLTRQRAGIAPVSEVQAEPEPSYTGDFEGSKPNSNADATPSLTKRIRNLWAEFPILPWKLRWRELFLREFLRLDGRGEVLGLTHCPDCKAPGFPEYRCEDCRGADLCKECILHWHRYAPLHKIERYSVSAGFYERGDNAELGIRIQLLHRPGEICDFRTSHSVAKFTIIHTNGIHVLPVDFCGCELGRHVPHHIQLMRWRLWPATCDKPQTATTFEALDLFTRLSVLGRLNVYDFHRALEAATDGAMVNAVANVRQQLTNCVRQFRHILSFKRAGRGHEPGGIGGTPPGSAAVICPACPNFDMNVPKDWATRPFRWLYRVILSLDGNFRLSNKLTNSTTKTDPALTDGKAYMAPWEDYAAYLCETDKELAEQASDCSRFGALLLANQKGGKGMRTTGVAGCFCARHGFVQPLGIATMRKGERFNIMDYVLCGALSYIRAAEVTVGYDVVCQYCKRISERLGRISPHRVVWVGAQRFFQLAEMGAISYIVPKFHLYAHKLWCQIRFSLLWLRGTGLTDAETAERVWAGANPAAPSLREMGPGGMSDTMDDICGAWNWQKVCGIDKVLVEHMDRALDDGETQTAIYTELSAAIEAQDSERLEQQRALGEDWEKCDKLKADDHACPYYIERHTLSVADIVSQTEQTQGSVADATTQEEVANSDMELAQFLLKGMNIEEQRARILTKFSASGGTVKQATARTHAMNALVRAIVSFHQEQEVMMPCTYAALTAEERDPERKVALTVQLCMPSSPPYEDRSLVSGAARAMETKLRWASMVDALDNLLHQLRLKGCLNKHKVAHVTGQRGHTRAITAATAVNANVRKAAEAYRRHRVAYSALVGPGEWEKTMRVLDDSDCRGLGDRLIEQMEDMSKEKVQVFLTGGCSAERSGETEYKLPWIWSNHTEESAVGITDELMVEWSKCRARALHWVEEVRLVDAEMQRVLDFSESMACVWDEREAPKETIQLGEEDAKWAKDDAWADGVRAYASKQASIRRAQKKKWQGTFAEYRKDAQRFLAVHTSEGTSLEPLAMLTHEEVDDMKARSDARRKRRTKVRCRRIQEDEEDSAAEDSTAVEEANTTETSAITNADTEKRKGKETKKVGGTKVKGTATTGKGNKGGEKKDGGNKTGTRRGGRANNKGNGSESESREKKSEGEKGGGNEERRKHFD